MFYFSLVVFLICGWILPWWCLGVVAMVMGILLPGRFSRTLQVSGAGALAWAALAYIFDGRSHGQISHRMSGLFGMPSPWLMFLLMGILGTLTVLFSYQAGVTLRRFANSK